MIKKNPEIADGCCWECGADLRQQRLLSHKRSPNKRFCNEGCQNSFYKKQLDKIVQLRVQSRLSINEISVKTGAAKSSISKIVKDFPLTKQEIKERHSFSTEGTHGCRKKRVTRKYEIVPFVDTLDTVTKGHLSESAVLSKCTELGYVVYSPIFDGQFCDFIIADKKTKKTAKIQVKTTKIPSYGMPIIPLRKSNGRKKYIPYQQGDFDIIIGYDIAKKDFYIYLFEEISRQKITLTVQEDARNRWDKIQAFLA